MAYTIGQWGYPGIIALMFLESSFFPFPSEVVVPPPAYPVGNGEMNIGMVAIYWRKWGGRSGNMERKY